MTKLKVAVITDGDKVQAFALDAIDRIADCDEIKVFACTNSRFKRRPWRHFAYYVLNRIAIHNRMTRYVTLARCTKAVEAATRFESGYRGNWQVLPHEIIAQLAAFDVVIKLGMGLLTIPAPEELGTPILSYHHGDPGQYRGRPAGFWEIWNGAETMGQIVQVLSNRLDSGRVVAFAETKIYPHSYRSTLLESYRHSPLIINKAIRNTIAGAELPVDVGGPNYRLPSNLQVVRFLLRSAGLLVKRLTYGILLEKKWRVSLAPAGSQGMSGLVRTDGFPATDAWETLSVAPGYTFYADPFFSSQPPGVLVEALRRTSGLGELVLVEGDRHSKVSTALGHHSYPSTIEVDGIQFVLPETAQWSAPRLYGLSDGRLIGRGRLRIEDGGGVIDPTLVEHEGKFYLFGNRAIDGSNVLSLWWSESLGGVFRPHPDNPVRITPRGSRMGGGIARNGGRLYRFGQNFAAGYGDGLYLFEIETLDPGKFSEQCLGEIKFRDRSGPHTLNLNGERMVFDWYRNRFSLLAGLRRLSGRLRKSPPPDFERAAPVKEVETFSI